MHHNFYQERMKCFSTDEAIPTDNTEFESASEISDGSANQLCKLANSHRFRKTVVCDVAPVTSNMASQPIASESNVLSEIATPSRTSGQLELCVNSAERQIQCRSNFGGVTPAAHSQRELRSASAMKNDVESNVSVVTPTSCKTRCSTAVRI